MPAKTKPQSDDMNNPYGYSEMDWAAQLDPAYAAARAEVRRLSVGEEGILSVKVKELVVIGVLTSRGLQYGVAAHMRRAIEDGATKEALFEAITPTTTSVLDRLIFPVYAASKGADDYQEAADVTGTSYRRRGVLPPAV
jgi:alkylhydroperoxidase/carboxymuconolactone decarboxylase family protein YurZ